MVSITTKNHKIKNTLNVSITTNMASNWPKEGSFGQEGYNAMEWYLKDSNFFQEKTIIDSPSTKVWDVLELSGKERNFHPSMLCSLLKFFAFLFSWIFFVELLCFSISLSCLCWISLLFCFLEFSLLNFSDFLFP